MKVLSIEEQFRCVGPSIAEPHFRTFTTIDLGKGIKAKCWVDHTRDSAGLSLSNNTWEVAHSSAPKVSTFKYKRSAPLNTHLTITQHVPEDKWFLIPTPIISIKRTTNVSSKIDNVISASWDSYKRNGSASTQTYFGDDREYKIHAALTSVGGLSTVGARAKVKKGLLHSVAAEYSKHMGPVLIAKSRIGGDGEKPTKLTLAVSETAVNLLAENVAGDVLLEKSATVNMHLTVPYKKYAEPSLQLNLKYNFD